MNVGVIGAGVMGKNHIRVYSELKGVDKLYVYDTDSTKTKMLKDVVVANSLERLLQNVDAVSICVPTKHHFEVAKRVVEKNVHCLIEKPIALTVADGEKLLKVLKEKSLIVGIGHIERFNPIVDEIKRIIRNPLYVDIRRHNPASARITDSTIIEDVMIHDIDIVLNVLFCGGACDIHSAGNDDLCTSIIKFGDSIVSLSASRKSSKKIRTIYIEEEDFTIEGDFMNQEIYVYRKPGKYVIENERYTQENIIEKVLVNKVEPLKEELKTFIWCVLNSEDFPVTPLQAVSNLRICEEIRRVNAQINL